MSPHHIDLPLASPAQELPFDRESAGEGAAKGELGAAHYQGDQGQFRQIHSAIGTNTFDNLVDL